MLAPFLNRVQEKTTEICHVSRTSGHIWALEKKCGEVERRNSWHGGKSESDTVPVPT